MASLVEASILESPSSRSSAKNGTLSARSGSQLLPSCVAMETRQSRAVNLWKKLVN